MHKYTHIILFLLITNAHAQLPPQHDTYAAQIISELASPDSAAAYQNLLANNKKTFLKTFWQARNPLIYKYYYGHMLGERPYSVSESYVENQLPERFRIGATSPDSLHIDNARTFFKNLAKRFPNDPIVLNAYGYALLEANNPAAAERIFLKTLEKDRKLVEARNGRGLAYFKLPKQRDLAIKQFQNAAAQDKKYQDALYNLALCQLAIGAKDLAFHFNQVLKRFPNHPEAHFKFGVAREDEHPEKALASYNRQIEVNPKHYGAYLSKGRVLLNLNRPEEAIKTWQKLIDIAPSFRPQSLPLMLLAYQNLGKTTDALATASSYIRTLDDQTQMLFRDIRLIATPDEVREYEALPPNERTVYELAFWQKRDPTPATRSNERLVEHYRRILYALDNFSEKATPWDQRGNVYIRYGEPAHRSKHDYLQFEFDPRVIKVKERLWAQIPPSGRQEIIASISRIRTSIREVVDGQSSDFESIDYLQDPNSASATRQHRETGDADLNQPSTTFAQTIDDLNISNRDRGIGVDNIRGFPIYPVEGDKPWEYWIYPDVNDGVEIVFTALTKGSDFAYPTPPQGRAISSQNATMWLQRQPENVVKIAVNKQGDTYRPKADPLPFYYAHADFRSGKNRSRLEIYYGIPMHNLSPGKEEIAQVERGIAIFDQNWKPLLQKSTPLAYKPHPNPGPGLLIIDQLALNLNPGTYYLGVQTRDPQSGRWGSATKKIEVIAYPSTELKLSALQLASSVTEQPDLPAKGGHKVSPQPSRSYSAEQPVVVYYEIYGLSRDNFGQTNYHIDVEILPTKKGDAPTVRVLRAAGNILGIDKKEGVTISYEQTGDHPDEFTYLEIDISDSKSGEYKLLMTVTDKNNDTKTSRETSFWIVE